MAVKVLKIDEFESKVLKADAKVMVDFYATWCGPCKVLGPVLDAVEGEVGEGKVYKLDVDECPEIASKYGVMSVPTIIVFENGEEVNRSAGVKMKSDLLEMLK